ncbi:MAG: hypothetical protein ABMB14_11825 [Myxococcota bacterium]
MTPIPVQLSMFGGENVLVGLHVVSAHTRLRSDGTEVFVGEHLRWNRGQAGRGARRDAPARDDAQVPLFG